MSDFWTIVPVKDTRLSKQRLSGRLTGAQRQKLALTMLEDVLDAIVPTEDLSPIVLVTVDPGASQRAERLGLRVLTDGAHDGHTGAVTTAAGVLGAEGAGGFLTLPGDLPMITTQDVRTLLEAHLAAAAPAFTIAPSHDKAGSNAIACSPTSAVPLRFGDDSFFPHLDTARACGIAPTVLNLPSIAEDIDTPRDIDRFMSLEDGRSTRTYALLEEFGYSSPAAIEGSA